MKLEHGKSQKNAASKIFFYHMEDGRKKKVLHSLRDDETFNGNQKNSDKKEYYASDLKKTQDHPQIQISFK